MKIGLVYPQTEFGSDPAAIRDYAQTAEDLGFSHILAYDHVLGANPIRPEGFEGAYSYEHPFQSPFLLFSYMAAVTERLGFATGVIILPQRQTALVAKQAATLDVLSGGRLRLGVGIGWNAVEYTALNEDFYNRGRRCEEQVELMKLLWTRPLVEFSGNWHRIPDAGINPLPVQRPIPVWFGGHADGVLKRMARLGDGWMPMYRKASEARPALDRIERYLEEAGRRREDFGIEARLLYHRGNPKAWHNILQGWKEAGATHISFNTMKAGFSTPQQHLVAVQRLATMVEYYSENEP